VSDTGAIDANRLWVRKPDGSGDLDGSITLEYPQHPNVDVTWVTPSEPAPEFDLSDGFTGEDIQALINNAGDVAQKVAIGAAGVGIALGGVVVAAPGAHAAPSTGVSQIGGNTAAQAFADKMTSTNTAAVVTGRRGEVSAAKTTACQVAQTRHAKAEKRAERAEARADATGNKKAEKKAKKAARAEKRTERVMNKQCGDVLPAGAIEQNPDGTYRYSMDWFHENKPTRAGANVFNEKTNTWGKHPGPTAKEIAAYADAVRGVSGANWRDQSHLPPWERVGLPPGTPQQIVDAVLASPESVHMAFTMLNAKSGERLSSPLAATDWEVLEVYPAETSGGAMALRMRGYDHNDVPHFAHQWRMLIAMPDGTARTDRQSAGELDNPQRIRLEPSGALTSHYSDGSIIWTQEGRF